MAHNPSPPRNSSPLRHPGKQMNRLIQGLPYEVYARAEGINNSGLVQLLRSAAHYRHWVQAPAKPMTPALELGKLAHLCILEPNSYEQQRLALGDGLKAKEREQHSKVQAMRDAVWANSTARKLLEHGQREASLWWDDPAFQVRCKARVDFVSEVGGRRILLDLKTTKDASRLKFSRSITDYRYDMQAAHYLEGGKATGAYDPNEFFFIVVENEPPHACVVYSISDVVRGIGSQWRDEAMSRYATALRDQAWAGLPEMDEIGLSKWVKVPGEEDDLLI